MTGMSGVWKVRAAVCSSLSRPWPCFCPSCLATLRERCDKLSAVEMKEEEKNGPVEALERMRSGESPSREWRGASDDAQG
jgi:hypothetical protein